MSPHARVDSIDALKGFKVSLCKFAEVVGGGISEAEAEIYRVVTWLKHEQHGYWKGQLRKRAELVNQAKIALNNKKLYKTPTGGNYSTVEEEKTFRLAKKRFEEAEQKLANVKTWTRKLEHEMNLYKEQIRGAKQTVEVDVPNALAQLDRLVHSLDAYVAVPVPARTREAPMSDGAGRGAESPTMTRDISPPNVPAADYEILRACTPDLSIRDQTLPTEPTFRFLSEYEIQASQRQVINELEVEFKPSIPGDKVVLAQGCWDQPRIYLERINAQSPGDSGWYVGAAEGTPVTTYEAVRVDELLTLRPDWKEILSLPSGSLVVLDRASIETVLDGEGKVLWHSNV